MKSLLRCTALLALLLGLTAAARAQVTFTFTTTAPGNASAYGYTDGASYTFAFTMVGDYPENPDAFYSSGGHYWVDESLSRDDNIFTAINGSGLAGAYVRPTYSDEAPLAYVYILDVGSPLWFISATSNDSGMPLGLLTPLGTSITNIIASASSGLPVTPHPEIYITPEDYFAPFAGTYNSIGGNLQLDFDDAGNLEFLISSLTISVGTPTPVPEPATTAALLGAAGLAVALGLRRRNRA
ncbi:MAG: PEP-CTERM sorting domain-containing protein [Verrucomicrobia bacterium]|nr:PEP-CTERM sorting domain-containing protein [Verrucomicrobiota bacterium]